MYVLNLVDRVEPNVFAQDAKKTGWFINSSFFTKLCDAGTMRETSIDQLEPNDLVVSLFVPNGLQDSQHCRGVDVCHHH